jgi:hypothetical protein
MNMKHLILVSICSLGIFSQIAHGQLFGGAVIRTACSKSLIMLLSNKIYQNKFSRLSDFFLYLCLLKKQLIQPKTIGNYGKQ